MHQLELPVYAQANVGDRLSHPILQGHTGIASGKVSLGIPHNCTELRTPAIGRLVGSVV